MAQQQQHNKNRGAIIGVCGVVLALLLWWLLPSKQIARVDTITVDPNIELKKQVAELIKDRNRLKGLILQKDTARPKQIKRYGNHKTRIGDVATAPCDTIREYLPFIISDCDSIIASDSFIIATLKDVVEADNAIISKKDDIIANDSTTIDVLNRKAGRLKRQRNIAAGVGVVGWLLALIR